eukprot:4469623-Ditylum_brightwellii.AAC.1
MEQTHTRGRLRRSKKRHKGKNKRKTAKRWKQKDIREAGTDKGQGQTVKRKKTRKVTTEYGDQHNKAEDQSEKGDIIKQT